MKKVILGLSSAVFAMILIYGCEKETVRETNTSAVTEASNDESSTTKSVPFINLSTTVGSFCGSKVPCGTTMYSMTKNNMMSVTNNSQTWFPSLRYTFYISIGGSSPETFVPIAGAQYVCSLLTSYYASGTLNNGSRIMVIANLPASTAPSMSTNILCYGSYITGLPAVVGTSNFKIATMGNFEGVSCGDPK